MVSLLLAIIYLAFISLGLPDSLLGSAWPAIRLELGVPISYAGIVSMIIAVGTIISSLASSRVIRRFGPGLVTAVSVALTAAALFGFSVSHTFPVICLWAVPYGLGAGAVDAALNNYVAVHYSSRHMSWLHAFWGVGVTVSPYIMSACLTGGLGWQAGYRNVSVLQILLTVILFAALPLWKRTAQEEEGGETADTPLFQGGSDSRRSLCAPGLFRILRLGDHRRALGQQLFGRSQGRGSGDRRPVHRAFLHGGDSGPCGKRLSCRPLRRQGHDPHGNSGHDRRHCPDAAAC